jgi:predicted SAM-dependent methyltransferase
LKLIVGAGSISYEGWFSTDKAKLDITNPDRWDEFIRDVGRPHRILAEHVIEHIPPHKLHDVASYMHHALTMGGMARIAVPDGLHPNRDYIHKVHPPGDTHVAIYDYRSLSAVFLNVGFSVRLVEWWNELRDFNAMPWEEGDGYITRAWRTDHRNRDGKPNYTSLIIDCMKL